MNLKIPEALLDYSCETVQAQLVIETPWDQVSPYNWQVIRAMAYLYVHESSPLKGAKNLGQSMKSLYRTISASANIPDNRLTGHLAEARELMASGAIDEFFPEIDALINAGAEELAKKLHSYRYLKHFTSANLGTGTNHAAVFAASVYRAGMVLKNQRYIDLASSTMDRMVADMDPDGYWAETTGGPSTLYNNVTFCSVGRMARFSGNVHWRAAALRGALFHRRFSYPDGTGVETIDGRCRGGSKPMLWGGFIQSETPEGRAYVLQKMKTIYGKFPPGAFGSHGGECAALLCEDHQYWVDGPVGCADSDRQNYVEQLRIPGGIRREGPWVATLQGITALPRGYGNFTIDRTGLLSLWHERTGLIINGSGEPGETASRTFSIHVPTETVHHCVPEQARLKMGGAGTTEPAELTADFRGGTVELAVHFLSSREVRVEASAYVRDIFYPVQLTLQLELREGDRVNGFILGQDRQEIDSGDLLGRVVTGRFEIEFPADGASFSWPHDPYNPYDLEHHKSTRDAYVALLKIPISHDGVRMVIRIKE